MNQSTKVNRKGNTVAIITMFFLFAMISFVTNLAAPVGTIWKSQYEWSGMLGNLMNFLAYLFMGIPAGNMLARKGYKFTAMAALIVGVAGLFLQYMSGIMTLDGITLLWIYLSGAFVCGFSVCMLNTVGNPMLNSIGGGGNRGNQLIQAGSTFNSLAGTLTPFFVGMLIGQITKTTTMADVTPLVLIGMGVFALAFIILAVVRIPEPHLKKRTEGKPRKYSHSPWSFRHTTLGVIGIFFYVGIEVGIPAVLIFYLSNPAASGITVNASAVAGSVAAVYWLLMLVGRFTGSLISGVVSSRTQLITVSSAAIILVVGAILTPASLTVSTPAYSIEDGLTTASVPMSALLLVLVGLCTSVMWGGIFNLAVEGLGKYTAQASGIFMMMVVGGGVMPFIQEQIAGDSNYMASYWLVVAMLAYLLYYGLIGSKNVNTDIPVDEEPIDLRDL